METAPAVDTNLIRIESYGVRIDIQVDDPELVPRVLPLLPPGWQPAPGSFADAKFALSAQGDWRFVVRDDADTVSLPVDLDVALAFLEWRMRGCVALLAPERVFVHAGVVARNDRALLLPGLSFSGKTTLVAALVRAGAEYFSDEFAVLDPDGFVHPYPKPLSLRPPNGAPTEEVPASALGGETGDSPQPVALVAVTSYVPGARWDPSPLSSGETGLALVSHSVPAQARPLEALRAVRCVAERCACVRGDRGEAEPTAAALLAMLEDSH
ncbi:MAG: hypothetical protein ACREME_04865 [Gemmatimonadales bacterium]